MTDWIPWKIARKELKVTSRKRSIIFYIIFLPFLITLGFLLYLQSQVGSGSLPSDISLGFESIIYFYVVLASVTPSSLAAYSIVGEKIEKSLEPLLATPTTDGEILLGKSIAAFLPPVLAIWAAGSIFMGLSDYLTGSLLSYYYFPNWTSLINLFLLAPLAAILSIELSVIVSSKVTDVRGANQIGSLMFIPFMFVFLLAVEGIIAFDIKNLLIFSAFVVAMDFGLYFVSKSTFNREEILTKWK